MKKYIVGVGLVVLIILIGGSFILKNQNGAQKTYTDSNLTFQYPADWRVMNSVEYEKFISPDFGGLDKEGMPMKPDSRYVYLISPDATPDLRGGMGPLLTAGYLMVVSIQEAHSVDTRSFAERLAGAKAASEDLSGTYEAIKIDDRDAILSDTNSEGFSIHSLVNDEGKDYYFEISYANSGDPKIWPLMKSILTTVRIR